MKVKAIEKLRMYAMERSIADCRYQNYTDDYCYIEVGNDPDCFFVAYYGDYSTYEFGYAYCAIVPKNIFSYRELRQLEKEYNVKLL